MSYLIIHTITSPILQKGKLRLREVKLIAALRPANRSCSQSHLAPSLGPEPPSFPLCHLKALRCSINHPGGVGSQTRLCLHSLRSVLLYQPPSREEQGRLSIWTSYKEDPALSTRPLVPPPHTTTGSFLRRATEQTRTGDSRGSGLPQAWRLSSSSDLGDFPTLANFTSPVSCRGFQKLWGQGQVIPKRGSECQKDRGDPVQAGSPGPASGSLPVRWRGIATAPGYRPPSTGTPCSTGGAAAMKAGPTHTNPLTRIGLDFKCEAEHRDRQVRHSDGKPWPGWECPLPLLPLPQPVEKARTREGASGKVSRGVLRLWDIISRLGRGQTVSAHSMNNMLV